MTDEHSRTGNEPALGGHAPILDVRLGSEKQLLHAVEALGDENPAIRDRASQYLVKLGDARVTDYLLQEITCSDETHRRRAIRGLGNLKEPSAVEPLVARLYGTDKPRNNGYDNTAMRLVIIEALGRIGDANAIRHLREIALGRTIRHMDLMAFRLRPAAVAALNKAGDVGLFDHMLSLAQQGDDTAITVLGYIADRRAVPFLLERLETLQEDPNCPVLRVGVNGTGIISRDEIIEQINHPQPRSYPFDSCDLTIFDITQVLYALNRIGDARAVDALIHRLHGSREVSSIAALALGSIADPRAVQPLMDAILRDYPPNIIRDDRILFHISALGRIGDPRSLDLLLKIFDEMPDPPILVGCLVDAFGNIGTERVVKPIISVLKSHDLISERQGAIEALGKNYDLDASIPEALIHTLESDRNQEVRRDAATVLGQHREVRAVDALIKAFNEDRPKVQREAKLALKRIGTPEALAAIK